MHRRQDEQVGGAEEVRQGVAQHRAGEMDPAGPPRSDRREPVPQVAPAGQHHVRLRRGGQEIRQRFQKHLEPLLGRHSADAEEERRRVRDAEPLAPDPPPLPIRREGRYVHAVGDHPRALRRETQSPHPVDQLGRAAGEQPRAGQGPAGEAAYSRLLRQEHVAAVEPDGERHPAAGRGGHDPIGNDPVGMDQVEPPAADHAADGPPQAEQEERRHQGGARPDLLVRFERPAVAEDLRALRRIAEGDDLDASPFLRPPPGQPLGMGRQHGHPVPLPRQSEREVPDEGTRQVPRKTRIGLGQEEEVQSSRSLTE